MESVSRSQHRRHPPEQEELTLPLASSDHQNSDGDDRDQIDNVKQGFCNCLHLLFFMSGILMEGPADDLQYGGGIMVLP